MALDFDIDDVEKREGGKGLRRKLEEALKENRELRSVATAAKAQEVIGANGLNLVTADDLQGVALDELEAKAAELQEQKVAERRQVVAGILSGKGLEGDELDAAIDEFIGGSEPASDESRFANVHESALGDQKPARTVDPSKLHGTAAIEYALQQQERKRK